MINMVNIKSAKGFSLLEYIIAFVLIGVVMSTLFALTVGGVKNGRFVQKLADVKVLASQKATDLYKDLPNQLKNIPLNQSVAGSIDPNNPAQGYFELLNDSGCIVSKSALPPGSGGGTGGTKGDNPPPGDGTGGGTGGGKGLVAEGDGGLLGGPKDGGGTGEVPETKTMDCTNATVEKPSNSAFPRFRRQWLIAKDKPNIGDATVYVVIVYQDTNILARSSVLIKVDGTSSR